MRLKGFKKIDIHNPKVQMILVMILVGVGGSLLWYQYIIVDKRNHVAQLRDRYNQKQNELNKIFALKPKQVRLQDQVNHMNVSLDSLRRQFPDQKEIPRLITDITHVAKKANVMTLRFNPLPDSVREYHVENNYSLSVIGGYHELAVFFSHLANFELIINLSNVVIKMNPAITEAIKNFEEHGETIHTVIATFNLTTFSSKK